MSALFEAPPTGIAGTLARALRSLNTHPRHAAGSGNSSYRDHNRDRDSLGSVASPELGPDAPSAPSVPPAQFLGWTSAGTQIWARLRMAGLEVKCVFSWDLRRILLKVRCPQRRLEEVAERMHLKLRNRDGELRRFKVRELPILLEMQILLLPCYLLNLFGPSAISISLTYPIYPSSSPDL